MKKIFFSFIMVAIVIAACNQEPKKVEIPSTSEKAEKSAELFAENKASVEMEVEGMTCAMGCAKYIEDKVAELDGVVLSQVNFEEKKAHFEFDKTQTSSTEIESFINGIHDGQYKAKIADSDSNSDTEVEEGSEEEETISSVSENLNISFPELFTYFIKRIR